MDQIFLPEGTAAALLVQPVLTVVGMGDLNGVTIGQLVHRNLLLKASVYNIDEEMFFHRPPPKTKTWVGVYIDDLGVLSRLSKSIRDKGAPFRDTEILAVADPAYAEWGLLERAEKMQRNLTEGKVWGGWIGEVVSAGLPKLSELTRLTIASVGHGAIDKLTLQKLLGHWGFCLQFRRPLWCLLGAVYRWCEGLPETAECRHYLAKVANELLALALLANFLSVDVTLPVSAMVGPPTPVILVWGAVKLASHLFRHQSCIAALTSGAAV